jgi:holo-[acyl-carrier protein] synthase
VAYPPDRASHRDRGVVNLPSGGPHHATYGAALCRLPIIVPAAFDAHIDLAVTDEYPMAQAFVVISAVPMRHG